MFHVLQLLWCRNCCVYLILFLVWFHVRACEKYSHLDGTVLQFRESLIFFNKDGSDIFL
jgi:hypothetical protein